MSCWAAPAWPELSRLDDAQRWYFADRWDSPEGVFTSFDVERGIACGIRDSTELDCWGYSDNHASPEGTGPFTDVSVGLDTACGIQTDTTVECWELATLQPLHPRLRGMRFHSGAARFAERSRRCAIGTEGTLIGDCTDYRGGDFGPGEQQLPPEGAVTEASFGWDHACAVLTDGKITCWGWGHYAIDHPGDREFIEILG